MILLKSGTMLSHLQKASKGMDYSETGAIPPKRLLQVAQLAIAFLTFGQ